MYQWMDNQGNWHSSDSAGTPEDNGTAGEGDLYNRTNGGDTMVYIDPTTGEVAPDQQQAQTQGWPTRRLQGHLENPYAGEYGGQPGAANFEENRYANLGQQAATQQAPGQFQRAGGVSPIRGMGVNRGLAQQPVTIGSANGPQQAGLKAYEDMVAGRNQVAQQQLQQGLQQTNNMQRSLAASARGGGAGYVAAQQAAGAATAHASGQTDLQAQQLRAKQYLDGLQGYSQLADNARQQDLQSAGLSSDYAQQTAGIQEQQNQINAKTQIGYEGLRQGTAEAQQQGREWAESQNQTANAGVDELGERQRENAQNQRDTVAGTALTVGGDALNEYLHSDRRLKENVYIPDMTKVLDGLRGQ